MERNYETRIADLVLQERADASEPESRVMRGTAVVYNTPADIGPFIETIAPGAFEDSITGERNLRVLYAHNSQQHLASIQAGTLQVRDTEQGMDVEFTVADTTYGNDVLALVRSGEVRGMSIGFFVRDEGDAFSFPSESPKPVRRIEQGELIELTVTPIPAYQQTNVSTREIDPRAVQRAATMEPRPRYNMRKRELRIRR